MDTKFKEGDLVVCNEADDVMLTSGRTYTILATNLAMSKVKNDAGLEFWYFNHRFELVDAEDEFGFRTDKQRFKKGDLVRVIDNRAYGEFFDEGDVLIVSRVSKDTVGMYVAYEDDPSEEWWCFEYRFEPYQVPDAVWNADDGSFEDDEILRSAAEITSGNPKDLIGLTKPSIEFVPMPAVFRANEAFKDGAEKYGPFNWRENAVRADVYYNAAMRHLSQWYHGDDAARDSKVDHRAHAIACLMILIDAEDQGKLIDNRPKIGRPLDDFILDNTKDQNDV